MNIYNYRLLAIKLRKQVILIIALTFYFSFNLLNAQKNDSKSKDCTNCFSTEIIKSNIYKHCIDIQLKIKTISACNFALSHYTVEVPCGRVTNISNSGNWIIENPSNDPTTGISGFKIDNISGFGEDEKIDSFIVNYTICADDDICINEIKKGFQVAYKAGNCLFYEDINLPNQFSGKLITSDISCYGGNNGTISVAIAEGNGPFTYNWNTGDTTQKLTGLTFGTYSVVVTDSIGESIELQADLTQPSSKISVITNVIQPSCGQNDGQISLDITGGTQPYSYYWNNGQNSNNLDSLYAGNYAIQIIDANGCIHTESIQLIEESNLSVKLTPNFLECNQQGEGSIETSVSGGQEPYSYQWSNNDTTSTLSNVNSGSYRLTVTDSKGCSASATTYIGIKKLHLSTTVVNPTCFGGKDGTVGISSINYGNEPYQYIWNTGDTTSTIQNISSGRYQVTVTDNLGCKSTRTINVADRQQLKLSHSLNRKDCTDENSETEIVLYPSGGTPAYNIYLDGVMSSNSITVNEVGSYNVKLKDVLGCEINKTITINNDTSNLNIDADIIQPTCDENSSGKVSLNIVGGTQPYSYNWSDGFVGQTRDLVKPGSYLIEGKDANGCTIVTELTIDSLDKISTTLTAPSSILCESDNNIISATTTGVDTYIWEILDNDTYETLSSTKNQLIFKAGSGAVSVVYTAFSVNGCMASDTVLINCDPNDNTPPPTDTIPDSSSSCLYSKIDEIKNLGDGCYQFKINVTTNGQCDHELSHLSLGLDFANINWVTNSKNWSTDLNSTDPKTGIYGVKIDNINDFGQNGSDSFVIKFEACFLHEEIENYFPELINVAYKAGNGYTIQRLKTSKPKEANIDFNNDLTVRVFPNPFKTEGQIMVNSQMDINVEIFIYDISGSKVESIYSGMLKKDVPNYFKITGGHSTENIFFYKVLSKSSVIQGKILRIK